MESTDSGREPREITLETAIQEFLDSGNKSGNYRNSLKYILEQWRSDLPRGIETVDDVSKHDMAGFAKTLANDDSIGDASARTYYDYVSAFLSHAVKWDWIPENPAQKAIALDELPDRPAKKSGDQQFWTPQDRRELLRYADKQAHDAVDEKGKAALQEQRDRALAYVLAYSGARSGEILSDRRDDRRNGITWEDVDLDANRIRVLGKNQQEEDVQLPEQAHFALDQLHTVLDPSGPDWPVFVSLHKPTLYRNLPDDIDTSDGDLLDLYREHKLSPPTLSTNGGRSVLQRMSENAGLEIDGDYLKPHGARRGVGEAIYRERGAAAAQRVLRHADPRTTSKMYAHIETEELAKETSEVFENE